MLPKIYLPFAEKVYMVLFSVKLKGVNGGKPPLGGRKFLLLDDTFSV